MLAETPWDLSSPAAAGRMMKAAAAFVALLSPAQRDGACFPFYGDECFNWSYTPGPRAGLRLIDMTPEQQTAALALLDTGLSLRGAAQARQIIALETILRETEVITGERNEHDRNPGLYYFSIFGDPAKDSAWRWRANGHHLALHFTIAGGAVISATPLFFGANPAEVRHVPPVGRRTLAQEEDLARALLISLQPEQRTAAVVDASTFGDILTRNYRRADPVAAPDGISFAALSTDQRARLVALIRRYTSRVSGEVDEHAWRRIAAAGLDTITFAWAGAQAKGQAHYYVVKGPTFLIEYDNSQNDANHIHSVWRDITNDWGLDVLAQHYAAHHQQ